MGFFCSFDGRQGEEMQLCFVVVIFAVASIAVAVVACGQSSRPQYLI